MQNEELPQAPPKLEDVQMDDLRWASPPPSDSSTLMIRSRQNRSSEQPSASRSEPLFLPEGDDGTPPSVISPPVPSVKESEEVKARHTPPPPIKRRASPKPAGRPSLATATRQSYRGNLPTRYPSPPPKEDSLGPAAQYPYLPEKTPDGQELYSCRVGGPRIFDLLTLLPTEEFGVMLWEIIQREEELFEMEDVRDEDKVMLALWNRWIMVNRCASSVSCEMHGNGMSALILTGWVMWQADLHLS